MQNNFSGQNIMVNQQGIPMGHPMVNQNNGLTQPMVNSMNHDGQMNQMGHSNEQQLTGNTVQQNMMGVQHIPQQNAVVHQPMPMLPQSSAQLKAMPNSNSSEPIQIVTKQRLQDLVREIDQTLNLEEEVEEILLTYVDEFVDRCLNGAAMIAKNRHANSIEVKDVQQFLTRNYNMWTPGFGTDELKPYKKSLTTEAHKQRTALIRKTLKKY